MNSRLNLGEDRPNAPIVTPVAARLRIAAVAHPTS